MTNELKSLNDELDSLDESTGFREAVDVSGLKKEYNVSEVNRMLAVLPETIKAYDQIAIKKEFEYEQAKLNTKRVNAMLGLRASNEKAKLGISNIEDRKAWIATQPEMEKAEAEELVAKTNAIIAKSNRTAAENHFTSVRKVANLLESDLPNQQRIAKYNHN